MGESFIDTLNQGTRRGPFQPDDVLIETELAQTLRLSPGHLRNLRTLGGGPRYLRLGRSIRYRWQDVTEWLTARTVSSTSSASYSGEAA